MSKKPVWGLNCNLGIRRLWHGVECDLQATKKGLKIPELGLKELSFSDSEAIQNLSGQDYLKLVAQESEKIAQILAQDQSDGKIVIGGDHMVSFASVLATRLKYPQSNIGLLIFDSHDDFNLSQNSETGNFHGMWVRSFFTQFDHKEIEALTTEKWPLANLLYIGNLDMEKPVAEFFLKNQVQVFDEQVLNKDFEGLLVLINKFAQSFDHLHVSFDLDIVASEFDDLNPQSGDWAVNLPCRGGMPLSLVEKVWDNLQLPKSWSLDLVEFNEQRQKNKAETLKLAHKILKVNGEGGWGVT